IDVWGVGTRLVTGHDQPALGGVYKLSALRKTGEPWRRMVKLSDTPIKTSTPGILQVRRLRRAGAAAMDIVFDEEMGAPSLGAETSEVASIDPMSDARVTLPTASDAETEDLLQPILRGGARVWQQPASLADVRARTLAELAALPEAVRRFDDPEPYPVALEPALATLKRELIERMRSV
ncbi:MAG: nicotinate phosphoribosyltransferase, partial [Myxococcales bacterium]|nr:nicotinate phosphoribosyltransferase [Myxococcales bacterium]